MDNGPLPVTVPAMQAGVGHGRSSPRKYCTYIIYLDFIGFYLAHGVYIYMYIHTHMYSYAYRTHEPGSREPPHPHLI